MSIQEQKVVQILKKIEVTERSMTDPNNNKYLNLYTELKDLERDFLDTINGYEQHKIQFSAEVKQVIDKRKKIIEKKVLKETLKNGKR